MTNVLTVDVEDYYHVSAFESHIQRDHWGRCESRVVSNTHRLLELFATHNVQATFFVLGWVAEHFPELVRSIQACGHEIASHSYWHRLIYEQTPNAFRADLRRSKDVLEDLIGQPVVAHRAPSFSIVRRSWWALEILVEEGFSIDSSIFPIHHDRYGVPDAPTELHQLETAVGTIWEFPPSVVRMARMNVPMSGGGYFRLYPFRWTSHCLRRLNAMGRPFMFYIHPWEVDPCQPRMAVGSRIARWRHYLNLSRTELKLRRLLETFRFGRLCDAVYVAGGSSDELLSSSTDAYSRGAAASLQLRLKAKEAAGGLPVRPR